MLVLHLRTQMIFVQAHFPSSIKIIYSTYIFLSKMPLHEETGVE